MQEVDAHRAHGVAGGVVALAVGLQQGLRAGDRVVAGTAVQEVAAQAAEDDVVGVQRIEEHVVGRRGRGVRVQAERREVRRLLQRTRRVDDRDLRAKLGGDPGVEVVGGDRRDAGERLAV